MADRFQDIPGYEMIGELGEGGMATVYLAIQHSLDRKVAIKVMRRELRVRNGPMPEFERRFLLEGRTMAKLPHRNIVAVYDIVTRDDIAYISMELLEGGTLAERMRSGLSLGEAIGVVVQLANGLEYAHRNGVIHRDLKPSNVMFRDPGTPVLTDFGIAKHSDVLASRITQTGLVLGTPTYMSPEQASGRDIDGRADQYALGILFYEMLTGNPPFVGENPMAVLMGHALQPPPPLPDDLRPLQPIFDRMLAKDPNDRFDNLQDFVKALRGLVVGNDALVKQLGAITTASTSERLRALGFSGEYTGGDSGFALDLLRMPQTDPSISQRTTTSMINQALQRPRLLATLAAGIGVVVIALVLWAAFKPRSLSQDDQYLVRTLLREADRMVASGDLLAPPGANAFEDVQKVLQKDPGNEHGLELLGQIATTLRGEAEKSMAAGNLDAASETANQAMLVAPDDADVQALIQRIAAEQKQRLASERVNELLKKAGDAEQRKQRTGPDGAYALLRTALSLDPLNKQVVARLKAITDAEFASIRNLLGSGDYPATERALDELRTEFGSDPAFAALSQEVVKAQQIAADNGRIDDLVDKAGTALAADHVSEPAGDNAFEWFEQARQIDAGNGKVVAFKQKLATRLIADAKSAQGQGDTGMALDRSELALRVDPDSSAAKGIRDSAQQALGSRRAAIASQLNLARSAIASGRLLPPASDNARDVLEALLQTDPENPDALKLREALPRVVADALRGASERNDLGVAVPLAAAAAKAYPDDARIAEQIAEVRKRESVETANAERLATERRLADLLQQRPLVGNDAKAAINAILALRGVDSAQSSRYEQQLADLLADDMRNAPNLDAGKASLAAIEMATGSLGKSKALGTIESSAQARLATLEEQEKARLAAQNGELVINALPWGIVDRVLDAERKPIDLPEERSTPLTLTLPAGSYYVTLRHPQSGKTVSAFARVSAGKSSQTSGSFPTLSAEEYLKHAGL
ncbi:MAG: protein kinase [Xanthomonadales bacterium]|nr:protein kinase [Xanthomonadales bacterium]